MRIIIINKFIISAGKIWTCGTTVLLSTDNAISEKEYYHHRHGSLTNVSDMKLKFNPKKIIFKIKILIFNKTFWIYVTTSPMKWCCITTGRMRGHCMLYIIYIYPVFLLIFWFPLIVNYFLWFYVIIDITGCSIYTLYLPSSVTVYYILYSMLSVTSTLYFSTLLNHHLVLYKYQ